MQQSKAQADKTPICCKRKWENNEWFEFQCMDWLMEIGHNTIMNGFIGITWIITFISVVTVRRPITVQSDGSGFMFLKSFSS